MKQTLLFSKGLNRLLLLSLFLLFSSLTSAQCTAGYTMTIDPANNGNVTFTDASTGSSLNYFWDFGDGNYSTAMNPAHTYSSTGAYYVCLTVFDSTSGGPGTMGCSDTFCDSVYVINTAGCNAQFFAMDSVSAVYFYDMSTFSGPAAYFWDFGDGTSSTTSSYGFSHVYPGAGTYTACLTITTATCTDTYCINITVGSSSGFCDASFTLVQDSSNIYNYFAYMNTAAPAMGTYTYSWDFGDGTTSTLAYPSHTYTGTGPYWLCLTVTGYAFGTSCTDTYCDSLYAGLAMMSPLTLNVMPPVSTGITEEMNLITTLENYPNPFSGNTTITYTLVKDAPVELQIVNLIGEKVATLESGTQVAGTHTLSWNAEGLAEGMYLLQLRSNDQISHTRIILAH